MNLRDAIEIIVAIEILRSDYASSVEILCDNEDGPPNNAIECFGEWTNYEVRRYEGDSVAVALKRAVEAYRAAGHVRQATEIEQHIRNVLPTGNPYTHETR